MKKLLYIDTFSTGHIHEMFDASSLRMFGDLYDEIVYCANKDSIENIKHKTFFIFLKDILTLCIIAFILR